MCRINLLIFCVFLIINLDGIRSLKHTYMSRRTKRDVSEFFSDVKSVVNKRDLIDFVPWTHSQVLDKKGDIILKWQPRHQEISFRIEARTKGYVGIGFSPNGGMEGADILIGWIDDNDLKPYLLVIYTFTSVFSKLMAFINLSYFLQTKSLLQMYNNRK